MTLAEYRALAPKDRDFDPNKPQQIREILEEQDSTRRIAMEQQFAEDMSGRYGPYYVEFDRQVTGDRDIVAVEGSVMDPVTGRKAGNIQRYFHYSPTGDTTEIVVHNELLQLYPEFQGRGFSGPLYNKLEDYYRRVGIKRVEILAALDRGGYAWAARGFQWDTNPGRLSASMSSLRARGDEFLANPNLGQDTRTVIENLMTNMTVDRILRQLSPKQIAALSTASNPNLGKDFLSGSGWYGVYYLFRQ